MRLRIVQSHAVAASFLFVLATQANAQGQSPSPDAMMWSVSSASDAAMNHFKMGIRSSDIGQPEVAFNHFLEAVKADPSFALAHIYAERTANTADESRTHLQHAVNLLDKATPTEKLIIQYDQAGAAGDPKTQLSIAQQMVALAPGTPRPLLALANAQVAMNQIAEARATDEKAIAAAPKFLPAYINLGTNYVNFEPRDLAKAIVYLRKGADLEPNAPAAHDALGDAYRASNNLSKAAAEYTRVSQLDPTRFGFIKLGHVNSFRGEYTAARANYDKAISLTTPVNKSSYFVYRAMVNVHAGNPSAAERELEQHLAAIDNMDIPDKPAAKIFVLTTEFPIAFYNGHVDVATRVVDQLRTMYAAQLNEQSTPTFRRSRAANTVYYESLLASLKGDYPAARAKAAEFMKIVEPFTAPRKNDPAHFLLGIADFKEKKYATAAAHFAEANPNAPNAVYYRALALERDGKASEAQPLFKFVAENNFNSVDIALTKREAAKHLK